MPEDDPKNFVLMLPLAGTDRLANLERLRRFFVTVSEALRACEYHPVEITAGLSASVVYLLAELPPDEFVHMRDELLQSMKEDATRIHRRHAPTPPEPPWRM
jgi:hypothetical protein